MSNGFLVDTNVVSETSRRYPHLAIVDWYSEHRHDLFISVITLGELRRGEVRLRAQDAVRARRINHWLQAMELDLSDRVLPVTTEIAYHWGSITSQRSRPIADALIAATAIVHDLTLVTRNTKDFEGLELTVLNPWDA